MDAVGSVFLETNKFTDSALKEECEKEKMNADEVKRKISLDKHFCFRFGTILIIFFVYSCELGIQ